MKLEVYFSFICNFFSKLLRDKKISQTSAASGLSLHYGGRDSVMLLFKIFSGFNQELESPKQDGNGYKQEYTAKYSYFF